MKGYSVLLVLIFSFISLVVGQPVEKESSALFHKMQMAVNPESKKIGTVVFVGENTVYSSRAPGGKVVMDTRKAYNFAEQSRRTDFKSPAGPVAIFLENGKAGKVVKGRRTPLRPYEIEQLENGLQFHYLNIVANADKFNPHYKGVEEIEEKRYDVLEFTIDAQRVWYYLDKESHLPKYVRFQQYSEEFEEKVQITEHYFEWKSVKGIMVAFKKNTLEKQQVAGSFDYSSVTFN